MRSLSTLVLALTLAIPAGAQTLLSEAGGNWAGASNKGFFFLARLTQNGDRARLTIWNALDSAPGGLDDPQFDNGDIALGAFATRQDLEVLDSPDGSILQVVTEFADEEAEGRTVVQLRYLDNQFTVVGYYHRSRFDNPGGTPEDYECDLDLWNRVAIENGQQRRLEPVAFDALNASDWTWSAAFDRGYCTRTD
jgi:hypothetical protein